jgi:hypothetical protein
MQSTCKYFCSLNATADFFSAGPLMPHTGGDEKGKSEGKKSRMARLYNQQGKRTTFENILQNVAFFESTP